MDGLVFVRLVPCDPHTAPNKQKTILPSETMNKNRTNNNNAAFMALIAGAGAAGPFAASSSAARASEAAREDFIAFFADGMVMN